MTRTAALLALLWLALASAVAAGVLLGSLLAGSVRADAPAVSSPIPQSMFEPIDAAALNQPQTPSPEPSLVAPTRRPTDAPRPQRPQVAPVASTALPSHLTASAAHAVSGPASWFASPVGVSAAGPALRLALGPGWRGSVVRVTGPAGSAKTVLGDWMAMDRLIDLDVAAFPPVCGALSRGICTVEVSW